MQSVPMGGDSEVVTFIGHIALGGYITVEFRIRHSANILRKEIRLLKGILCSGQPGVVSYAEYEPLTGL